ncbi:MAG: hypothetical protein AABZ19_07470 [Pseudomonadota bacterium]
MWLLPPNPGPFGTLAQWREWQKELKALGPATPGVALELEVAEGFIAELEQAPELAPYAAA